jgi:hypothetical protein
MWLMHHSDLLRPAFEAFGGTVRKEMGDAFLCSFPSPTDAVLCAMSVQDRLWVYNQTATALMRIHVRVVVNMGEVRVEKGEIFGEPVNVAARVEDVADGGEVTLTEAVYLTMNRSEVEVELLGPHTLKGVSEPLTLYRVKQAAVRPPPGQLHGSYPYGGTQLHRVAREAQAQTGPALHSAPSREPSAGPAATRRGLQTPRNHTLALVAGALVSLVVVGGVLWRVFSAWRTDPFRPIEERLEARDVPGASAAWDTVERRGVKPQWKLDYYLGRISALEGSCEDLLSGYRDALETHHELASDLNLRQDVVRCVDSKHRDAATEVIRGYLGKAAANELWALAAETTASARARMSALKLLNDNGLGLVDKERKILDEILVGNDGCEVRKKALRRIAEINSIESRAALRTLDEHMKADQKKARENRCLEGALGETLRELDGR